MAALKCDRCGQEIKSGESWERDVHDKPFSPYESEYAFNKYGGNARHVGACPTKSGFCPCFNWAGGDVGSFLEHHPNCDGKGNPKPVTINSVKDAPKRLKACPSFATWGLGVGNGTSDD